MDTKTILLAVADPQALVDVTQALGHGWETTSVSTEVDALAQLEQRAFDALLLDFDLVSPDAGQLLNRAFELRPETPRFLLAGEADLALVAAYVSAPHELLPKPIEPASLKSRVESSVAKDNASGEPEESAPAAGAAAGAAAAPPVPAVYSEVLKALDLPDVTTRQVGELIAGDAALTAEVLSLTNSAHLGLPRDITDPVEAVESLGLDVVKALVMALRFLAEHSHLKPTYLSLEKLWEHSTSVARLARDLTLFETKDRALAAEALVAGLLHDLGKVVLTANFDDLYGRVHSLARKQPVALWEIEKEMFGATHGEIGACLVGMWNLPASVVQAAAFHHEPPLGEHTSLTPLAAVHIANVLQHERLPASEFRIGPVSSPAFLNEIGLLQRLPVWRAALANRRAPAPAALEIDSGREGQPPLVIPLLVGDSPSRTANDLPAPAPATQTATQGPPDGKHRLWATLACHRRQWAYAGIAAAALGFLVLWLETPLDQPVRALTSAPAPATAPAVASPGPAPAEVPEPALADLPEPVLAMAYSEEMPEADAATDLDLEPLLPESEPTASAANQVAATAAPPPAPAPALPESKPVVVAAAPAAVPDVPPPAPAPAAQPKPKPDFRLNGIIYTTTRPAAIVNGQTVRVGERVGGATVVSISRSQVALQVNGQRQTLAVR